jgi:methionine synthase I (cobalamin-dependent)
LRLGCTTIPPIFRIIIKDFRDLRFSAPNAGLPKEFGGYDETPDDMATDIAEWAPVF